MFWRCCPQIDHYPQQEKGFLPVPLTRLQAVAMPLHLPMPIRIVNDTDRHWQMKWHCHCLKPGQGHRQKTFLLLWVMVYLGAASPKHFTLKPPANSPAVL